MTTKRRIIGLGAGGHAKAVIEAVRAGSAYELAGLLDPDASLAGKMVLGSPVLGDDDMLAQLAADGVECFFVGVGSVGDTTLRRRLFDLGRQAGLEAATIVDARAIVSPSAQIGQGTVILAGAIVCAEAELGINVIVNTGAIVEHDCVVGDHAHVATGSRLCGEVRVGAGAHVGAGATVRQGITIGQHAIVGAGAVVVRDVPARTTVVGVPARPMRSEGSQP